MRVRLELARAFFLNRDDGLARDHFERVLAGNPPPPVVANVRLFLDSIRARRRWSTYLGVALLPSTNIGRDPHENTIIIIPGLPDFPFRPDETRKSGVGISVWAGGEYHYPLSERVRLTSGQRRNLAAIPGKRVRSDIFIWTCRPNPGPADAQCTSHRHPRRVNAQAQRRPELNIRASMSCATFKAAILRRPLNASPAMPKIYGSRGQTAVFRPRRINPWVNLCIKLTENASDASVFSVSLKRSFLTQVYPQIYFHSVPADKSRIPGIGKYCNTATAVSAVVFFETNLTEMPRHQPVATQHKF